MDRGFLVDSIDDNVRMAHRERVRRAIAASVDTASSVRAELPRSDIEARLLSAIDGWGRGLAAGLEELAVAIDEVSRLLLDDRTTPASSPPPPPARPEATVDDVDARDHTRETEPSDADVDHLRARAAASRGETEALRQKTVDDDSQNESGSTSAEHPTEDGS